MASAEFHKLKDYMAANPMPPLPYAEMREIMKTFGSRAARPEDVVERDLPDTPVPARLFTPGDAGEGLILFAHGGGFTLGSIESHAHVAAWLAHEAGRSVLVFDYRLAPEHPFPAALDDFRAIYLWALDAGHPPSQIAFAGDSAGANLSVSMAASGQVPRPGAIAALSPSFDLAGYLALDPAENPDKTVDAQGIADGFRLYLGDIAAEDPQASPNYADLSGLPPTFVQLAESEIFAPGALDLAQKAKAAGVHVEVDVWPEMMHDWHWYAPRLPEARDALAKAGEFIARHMVAEQ